MAGILKPDCHQKIQKNSIPRPTDTYPVITGMWHFTFASGRPDQTGAISDRKDQF